MPPIKPGKRWPVHMVFWVIALVGALAITASCFAQWENTDPQVRGWYQSLMQPDNPGVSCCGESDGYYADQTQVIDGKAYAIITDTRPDKPRNRRHIPVGTKYEIPQHKIQWKFGNAVGHVVIFINSADQVLCYIPNGGV